jgi:hypothetical protein
MNEPWPAPMPACIARHLRTHDVVAGKSIACVQLQQARTFEFWPAEAALAQLLRAGHLHMKMARRQEKGEKEATCPP